jgi:hypothetical protein
MIRSCPARVASVQALAVSQALQSLCAVLFNIRRVRETRRRVTAQRKSTKGIEINRLERHLDRQQRHHQALLLISQVL